MGLRIVFISLILSQTTLADTSVLPVGVRAFIYKYISASVPGTFNQEGLQKDFSVNEILGTQVIKGISPKVAQAYDELHKLAPQIAEGINLGKVEFDPRVSVNANVAGLAWGLTDKLMIAAAIPWMTARVSVEGGYLHSQTIRQAAKELRELSSGDESVKNSALAMAQALEQLPSVKGENLQAVIVNEYHYKPVGDWFASDVGDATVFLQSRFLETGIYRAGAKLGMDLPTGKTDDPDNLTDIAFGKGYSTTYFESVNDLLLLGENLMVTFSGRYQYNWDTKKTFRLYQSSNFPLSASKEDILYKPGNIFSIGGEVSAKFWRSLGVAAGYVLKIKDSDFIQGTNAKYDYTILESKTDYKSQSVQFSINYSTVSAFLSKSFPVPFKVGFNYSFLLSGINTEDVRQLGLDFEMYF